MDNTETKKIVAAVVVGVIGAGALYYVYAENARKTPVLKKIGRTIADVGEMIESCNLDTVSHYATNLEKKIPQGEMALNRISGWVSTAKNILDKINDNTK